MPDAPGPAFAWPRRHTPAARAAFRAALLAWFDLAKREMPWRRDRDPYRIHVSEVMLQQTTVAAAVPYFERFTARFPTLQSLAEAPESDVLAHWAGLGYYRRARHLHAAAKSLWANWGGEWPTDAATWAALPGVGRYILGAVLSQAFGAKMPIVEANTLRVLSRLFASRLDPREGAGKAWVWQAAERVLPDERPGDFNQAMMELGALVCTPQQPQCGRCPVSDFCEANRLGLTQVIPPPPRPKTLTDTREVAVAIADESGRILWGLRPSTAKRWAGFWELPRGVVADGESLEAAARRVVRELVGLDVELGGELATVVHGVTRFRITLVAFRATSVGREAPASGFYESLRALTPSEWGPLAMSTSQRKLARELAKPPRPSLF